MTDGICPPSCGPPKARKPSETLRKLIKSHFTPKNLNVQISPKKAYFSFFGEEDPTGAVPGKTIGVFAFKEAPETSWVIRRLMLARGGF